MGLRGTGTLQPDIVVDHGVDADRIGIVGADRHLAKGKRGHGGDEGDAEAASQQLCHVQPLPRIPGPQAAMTGDQSPSVRTP